MNSATKVSTSECSKLHEPSVEAKNSGVIESETSQWEFAWEVEPFNAQTEEMSTQQQTAATRISVLTNESHAKLL